LQPPFLNFGAMIAQKVQDALFIAIKRIVTRKEIKNSGLREESLVFPVHLGLPF
jgi:hypothetical protein